MTKINRVYNDINTQPKRPNNVTDFVLHYKKTVEKYRVIFGPF